VLVLLGVPIITTTGYDSKYEPPTALSRLNAPTPLVTDTAPIP